jgi:hypothetical protein
MLKCKNIIEIVIWKHVICYPHKIKQCKWNVEKFVNGMSDGIGNYICMTKEYKYLKDGLL